MATETRRKSWLEVFPSVRYVAPFATFLLCLATFNSLPLSANVTAPLWVVILGVVCVVCWPRELPLRLTALGTSTAIGAAVFLLWIAPDVLIPHYRDTWLFSNGLVGHTHSSLPPSALRSHWVLSWRFARAVLIVPVVEELFWRAWMMRWLIRTDFWKVPLGTYNSFSFFVTAALFASEHGPYWDVGLLTGFVYNWWMVRTKSVTNCIVMHAVTNGLLSAYVLWSGQWQFWQ